VEKIRTIELADRQAGFCKSKINWRAFLAQFVKQYLLKVELFTSSAGTVRCLVVLIYRSDIV
jgi:hypothetical protein